jgi:hypothetical protein
LFEGLCKQTVEYKYKISYENVNKTIVIAEILKKVYPNVYPEGIF